MQKSSFLQYLKFEKRFSSHTVTAYHGDLVQFENYLSENHTDVHLNEVSHLHIRSWIVHLMRHKTSPRSVNRKISSLKCYFRYLILRGELGSDPTLKVISPKAKRNLPVFVKPSDISRLFEDVDFGEGYSGVRDKTILETLYGTGIRRSELINLKVSDVDYERKSLRVMGKRNKARNIPLSPRLQQEIERYVKKRNSEFEDEAGYLFLTTKGKKLYPKLVYNLVRKYLSMSSYVEKKGPHVLRHSFATHISENGAELNSIKELLGHSNLAATQIYTHNSIEKMKTVYLLSHPKSKSRSKLS